MRTKSPRYAQRILAAAARLFGRGGFHEVRMQDIARAAEVSKGTLYRYFEDKEELYTALLAQASRDLIADMRQAVAQTQGGRGQLTAIVATVIRFFDAQPHLFELILRAEVRRTRGGAFPWQEVRNEGLRLVQAAFARGQKRGEFSIHDADRAALMLLGGLRSVVRLGKQPRPRDLPQRIIDDFLDGAATPR